MAAKRENESGMTDSPSLKKTKKPVRVWADGCFDMMHFGHANALRQARALGDYLVVGVHSDEEIRLHKGPPVMSEEERYEAVAACKWVDEVVRGAPYVTQLSLLEKYDIDFCAHGDDIVTSADGTDTYHEMKAAGKFKTFRRTEGVSTTDLVGRMLLLTKDHHKKEDIHDFPPQKLGHMSEGHGASPYTSISRFLPSSKRIVQFAEGREPNPEDKVVYIDGIFDLFHIGHIETLKKAKEMGDYLLVGVYDDKVANQLKGSNYPIMNLHERTLSVLSCKYVDEVIIGAPFSLTKEMIKGRIHVVVHGTSEDARSGTNKPSEDPYQAAKELGIYQTISSPSTTTTSNIIDRIIENRNSFEARNKKKEAKEIAEVESRK
eukprot:TRINITY_DN11224_c0_g1_i1.p1 TRINITY_DN11224_c0_g1~~TRINITY_DN11224_c0_g1_i1.p1  ORF type:complete len:376 (+),score=122.75 TRINITY_DN11224_c0_g1_i1:91-1218(+)